MSPNDQTADPTTVTVRKLSDGEAFTIPPGQFAFLLTEEVVCVPADALAFISIRAKIKFRGLVNVSGFHVDPGYRGQLTFSVFNAGPVPVHLKRGQPIFLIWYASLDCETALKKNSTIRKGIDPEIVTAVAGELQSFAGLSKKINDIDKSLGDRVHEIEKKQVKFSVIGLIVLGVAGRAGRKLDHEQHLAYLFTVPTNAKHGANWTTIDRQVGTGSMVFDGCARFV